jgi:hypothetical protein
MKKTLTLFTVMFLALAVGTFLLIGCQDPVNGEPGTNGTNGSNGLIGAKGPVYLSGYQTTAGINHAIASDAPLTFAGVIQSDSDAVIIPAGRMVTLVGEAAYTPHATGILIVEASDSVTGTGALDASSGGTVIVPADVNVSAGVPVVIQEGSIDLAASNIAVKGGITISTGATSSTNIINTALSGKTLYVLGDLTVTADITSAPAMITVLGDVYVTTADQSQSFSLNVSGDLDAQKLPTLGGDIQVSGDAKFGGPVTGIGEITIAGDATFNDALTTGADLTVYGNVIVDDALITGDAFTVYGSLDVTGAVTVAADDFFVGGVAVIGGNFGFTSVAVTFGNNVSFGGDVTRTTGGDLSFGGDVTLAKDKALTLTGVETVALAPGKSINGALTAGNAGVVLTPTTGAVLTVDTTEAKKITLGTAGLTLTSGELTVAAGAELGLGDSLTLAAGAKLINNGAIPITAAKSLILTADSAPAGIAGTGTITAGKTTITGVWDAVGATGTVTILSSADGATITAASATGLKAGAGAAITQAAGTSNVLTIATGTAIDLTDAGSITLAKAETDGGSIDLSYTSAKITGLTGGDGDQTFVDTNIANATYAVGTSGAGDVTGGGTAGLGNAWIGGGNDGGPNPIKATDAAAADVVIDKDTLVGANA